MNRRPPVTGEPVTGGGTASAGRTASQRPHVSRLIAAETASDAHARRARVASLYPPSSFPTADDVRAVLAATDRDTPIRTAS